MPHSDANSTHLPVLDHRRLSEAEIRNDPAGCYDIIEKGATFGILKGKNLVSLKLLTKKIKNKADRETFESFLQLSHDTNRVSTSCDNFYHAVFRDLSHAGKADVVRILQDVEDIMKTSLSSVKVETLLNSSAWACASEMTVSMLKEAGGNKWPQFECVIQKLGGQSNLYPLKGLDVTTLETTLEKAEFDVLKSFVEVVGACADSVNSVDPHKTSLMEKLEAAGLLVCPICYDNHSAKAKIVTHGKCSALLHKICLDDWLKIKNECPFCRAVVPADSYRHDTYQGFIEKQAGKFGITPEELARVKGKAPQKIVDLDALKGDVLNNLCTQLKEMVKTRPFYRLARYITEVHDMPSFSYGEEVLIMKHEQCKDKIVKKQDYITGLGFTSTYSCSPQEPPRPVMCRGCKVYDLSELYTKGHQSPRFPGTEDWEYVRNDNIIDGQNSAFESVIYDENFLRTFILKRDYIQKAILKCLIEEGAMNVLEAL